MSEKKKFEPTPSQALAIEIHGADTLVSAGAGSGKTQTLINRIIERIKNPKDDILNKLIVTFTKEAANELRGRLSDALTDLLVENPTLEHISEQIVHLGSADICTIDSFCLKLVRENFEQLGIDGGFRVADESENEVLMRDAMSEVIDTLYEQSKTDEDILRVFDCFGGLVSEEKLKDDLLDLYKALANTKDGLKTLCNNTELVGDFMDTPYGKALREQTILICEKQIVAHKHAIDALAECPECADTFADVLYYDLDVAQNLAMLAKTGTYQQIADFINAIKQPTVKGVKKLEESGIDCSFFEGTRNSIKNTSSISIKNLGKKLYYFSREAIEAFFEQTREMNLALYRVLSAFDEEYSRRKRAVGVCDFNDISRYAFKLLYDGDKPSSLADSIRDSYNEVYVDEYQDTNYIQDKIFYAISNDNRFLVGDIKQSIYRFRSAEPEIFSAYRRAFGVVTPENKHKGIPPRGAQIAMSENFRCDKGVIDFSNAVSRYMFLGSNGIPYDDSDDLIFAKKGCDYESDLPEVCIINKSFEKSKDTLILGEDDSAEAEGLAEEEALRKEAEYVASRIEKMIGKQRLANGKTIQASDIAVLLRSFSTPVPLYVEALEKRGIPVCYKGDERFFEKSEVLLALCILNAIDNPLREVYLAGAMCSVAFGFTLEDLAKIKAFSPDADGFYSALKMYSAPDDLGKRVGEFIAKLQNYREKSKKLSCCDMIAHIYAETGLLSRSGENERKSLLKLYDMARAYDGGRYKGLYSFLRYVESIRAGSNKEELGSVDGEGVRLMSVHGSKGLEFEVCFVSGCGGKLSAQDLKKPIYMHRDLGVNSYFARPGGLAKLKTIQRECSAFAIHRSYIEEEMRLLYVAMTRARSKLIITGAITQDAEKFREKCRQKRKYRCEYDTLHPENFLEWVLCAVDGNEELARVIVKRPLDEVLRERFEFEYPYKDLASLPSKLTVSKLSPTVLDEDDDDDDTFELDDLPSFKRGTDATATDIGTATHIFLQFCDFKSLGEIGFDKEKNRLAEKLFMSPQVAELVDRESIEKFINSTLYSELCLAGDSVMREYRFNVMMPANELSKTDRFATQGVLVQGVIDCLFVDKDGKHTLVDYKTDRVSLRKDPEGYLREQYSSQLYYYKRAMQKILGKEIERVEIYSVDLGKSVSLDI